MIRAYVHEPFAASPDTVAISILREIDEPGCHDRRILHLRHDENGRICGRAWDEFEPGTLEPAAPTLTLCHEEARIIANALIGYFGGVDDQRALRQDYQAERKRVDELVGILGDVARRKFG